MNDFYNEIIDRLGERNQITKCVEELSELQQVLCKLNSADTGGVTFENIVEEIADVEIMIQQIKIILDISDDEIATMKNYKIMRTAKRYLGGTVERSTIIETTDGKRYECRGGLGADKIRLCIEEF